MTPVSSRSAATTSWSSPTEVVEGQPGAARIRDISPFGSSRADDRHFLTPAQRPESADARPDPYPRTTSMDLMQVGATWLHLLATVAMLGYYAILGLVVLPAIRGVLPARELGESIAGMERRATPVIVGSLIAFLATGVYLMVTNTRYGGVGDIGSTWATIFLVKHLVVGAMVGLGVYIDALVVRGFGVAGSPDQPAAVRRLAMTAVAMTVLGAFVLLLTAAGQLS
jgi:uncharacterized membrane protein